MCGQSLIRVQAGQHCEGQQKCFFKYVNSQRRIRDSTDPLIDEASHLTNRDVDKAEMFNAMPSLPLSLTPVMVSGTPGALCWKTMMGGMILPAD